MNLLRYFTAYLKHFVPFPHMCYMYPSFYRLVLTFSERKFNIIQFFNTHYSRILIVWFIVEIFLKFGNFSLDILIKYILVKKSVFSVTLSSKVASWFSNVC